MDILESVKMASTTLVANKLRSSLTMLGIIIGNASVIAMVGIGQGAQKLAAEQFQSLGPNTLFVVPGSQESRSTSFDQPKTLVLEDAKAIASRVPTVAEVAPQISATQVITYQGQNSKDSVIGTTPEYLQVRSFEVAKGRFIRDVDMRRNNQVVVLGSELANELFPYQNPIGKRLRIKNTSFEIVGVLESKGSFLGNNQDNRAYIPLTTMANQLVGSTSPYGTELTFISISAKDKDSIRAAQFQIKNLLRLRHNITGEDDFDVQSQQDILKIVGRVTGGLTIMLTAIAGISLVVGGIGVMNIMLVSVTERTQEIGLRKAVGAKEQDILTQFLIEAVILSAVGGAFGTLIGVGSIVLVGIFSPLPAGVSPVAVILAVGVSGGIGLSFGVIPARRAAKLDPIVALRSA
ncbi:MAG: ABC transporter permease [Cyanobacteria bacterium QH_8_48_120]|nr:MAG: ABC transporter permease [Cyanobacteria bacterium QH_1_48_107]PSO60842.1 MAG: ABC transporter permease [Cyanobacteria bacterium QH_10_48_56]PSO64694.1 MAG: ABC transporter permease [Cyanobacteria bacterium QH_2_48_84]PSO65671.1 MAG: ABC transporter permease [Cyanobacteria bacterium QH_6_48_35]PSO68243.1 MAG: ABC transporter permease [Cyanobacteria bacterium QH_7_48_89]PSO71603.1 MAG: ABC transporter permease [Cyanobacteria bacterium QS_1_48_34]PSO71947.1 MAG: ABC transporter permease 